MVFCGLLIVTLIVTYCNAIWHCPQEPGVPDAQGEIPKYECNELIYLTRMTVATSNKTSSNIELSGFPYGVIIKDVQTPVINYTMLQDVILNNKSFNWPDGIYKSQDLVEDNRIVVVAPPLTIYVQAALWCKDLANDYKIAVFSEPIQVQFPEIGDCSPSDVYLPVINRATNYYELSNNSTEDLTLKYTLKNAGIIWESITSFQGAPLHVLQEFLITLFQTDKRFSKAIAQVLRDKFNAYNSSLTGETWHRFGVGAAFSTLLPANSAPASTIRIAPNRIQWRFQIVGQCGIYTVYSEAFHVRQFYLNGTCLGPSERLWQGGAVQSCAECNILAECYEDTFLWKQSHPTFIL